MTNKLSPQSRFGSESVASLLHLLARRASLWAAFGLLAAQAFAAPPARAAVTEAWVHRYHGPSTNSDYANAVAVDGSGNVVVTGYSGNGPPNDRNDYYTVKYAAADGALLWEKRGAGNIFQMVLDGSGNVVITGSSGKSTEPGLNELDELYTAKYAALDGALLWEKRGAGPASMYPYFGKIWAVAVDGSGNVVVTGGGCTAKYAAADGALLWERRYNGPANGDDRANAVAVDDSGNVVVTGYSIQRRISISTGLFWPELPAATLICQPSLLATETSTSPRQIRRRPPYGLLGYQTTTRRGIYR
jgi:hypothetical protein